MIKKKLYDLLRFTYDKMDIIIKVVVTWGCVEIKCPHVWEKVILVGCLLLKFDVLWEYHYRLSEIMTWIRNYILTVSVGYGYIQ